MLKDGRIAEQGKHDELMARNGLYRDTYLGQLASQGRRRCAEGEQLSMLPGAGQQQGAQQLRSAN